MRSLILRLVETRSLDLIQRWKTRPISDPRHEKSFKIGQRVAKVLKCMTGLLVSVETRGEFSSACSALIKRFPKGRQNPK